MRKIKQIMAWMLAMVFFCNQIPVQAFAMEGHSVTKEGQTEGSLSEEGQPGLPGSGEEPADWPGTEEGQPGLSGLEENQTDLSERASGSESQLTVSSGDGLQGSLGNELSVQGTNSFGMMFANELTAEVMEQKENNGCNVFSVDMTDNTAIVSFESVKDAVLVIGIYDEAGKEMLASGSVEIHSGERDAAVDFVPLSLPRYYYIRGFLVDALTYQPLCTVYESPMYTREMQEFLSKTTSDFEADRVLNLDEDETNNFAVYGEDTIVISGEDGQNEVVSVDEENNVYIIENAGSNILSLRQGDIFAYPYTENNDVLIVKVASMEVQGTTATIIGAEISMEDAFDYIKIDTTMDSGEAVIDPSSCGEGVTYLGMVEYADENKPQTYAEIGGETELASQLAIDREYKDKDGGNSAHILGGLELKMPVSIKLYLTFSSQYVEVKLDISATISVSVSGKLSQDIPLITWGYMFAGIIIEVTPSFIIEVEAEVSISGTFSGSVGFRKQMWQEMENISSAPRFDTEWKAEGSIFLGFSLEPKMKVLSDNIASVSLTARIGAKITATPKTPEEQESENRRHTCSYCLAGEICGEVELSGSVEFLNKWKGTINIVDANIKIADFHYSVDLNEFGWGVCRNYEFRYKFAVMGTDRKPIEGAVILSGDKGAVTDAKGEAEFWLPVMTAHEFTVSREGFTTAHGWLYPLIGGGFFPGRLPVTLRKVEGGSGTGDSLDMRLSLGGYTSSVITKEGNLYLWGNTNESMWSSNEVPVKFMSNVKKVEPSWGGHSAVITEEGDLYLWGANGCGQLGNGVMGSWDYCATPVKIMSNVKEVSLGSDHSAAITEDGKLYLWGMNEGALGDGTDIIRNVPEKIMDHVKEVSLASGYSAAITEAGDLYLWGANYSGQLGNGTTEDSYVPIKIMSHVKEVSLGGSHSAAITEEGDLYLWGFNRQGQLGNGTTENSSVPIKVMSHVKEVSLGDIHSAAITEEGDLYLWGGNDYSGQLGNGTTEDSSVPIKIMSHVKEISLGRYHSAAITESGELYLWGDNSCGQLGNGTTQDSSVPIKVTIPSSVATASLMSLSSQEAQGQMLCDNDAEPVDAADLNSTALSKNVMESRSVPQAWNGTSFTGLIPGETYNYYVVKERIANQPFSSDGLLYIGQAVSDENGTLSVAFAMKDAYADADIFAVPMHSMDLTGASVSVPDLTYSGDEQYAEVNVIYDGITLTEGIDYLVGGDYGVTQEGNYTLNVGGIGLYTGMVSASYKVLPGVKTAAVSGTVVSYGKNDSEMLLQLLDQNESVIASISITENRGTYEFSDVEQGNYILRVVKQDHVTRDYAVLVGNQPVTLDAEIWLTGDVNGDGRINAMDKRVLYNHMAAPALTGYEFAVGDVNGDGKINAVDKRMIYNHISNTAPLW